MPSTDSCCYVEVEPIFEVRIGMDCQLMSMVKATTQLWYVQDGNGGIWSCVIDSSSGGSGTTSHDSSRQLYRCHAGAIVAVVTSPCSGYMATLGADGRLHIYNYVTQLLVFHKRFRSKGAAISWPSLRVAKSGNSLVVAFESGVIRVLVVEFRSEEVAGKNCKCSVTIISITKIFNNFTIFC